MQPTGGILAIPPCNLFHASSAEQHQPHGMWLLVEEGHAGPNSKPYPQGKSQRLRLERHQRPEQDWKLKIGEMTLVFILNRNHFKAPAGI